MGNKQSNKNETPEVDKEDIRDGPVKKRGCTDILCLLLFLAFIGGWIFVAYLAFSQGDIDKVLHPTDSKGNVCGRGELEDKPYLMFFDLTKCLNVSYNEKHVYKMRIFYVKTILAQYSFDGFILGGSSEFRMPYSSNLRQRMSKIYEEI